MPWTFPIARRLGSFFFGTSKSSKESSSPTATISSSGSSSSLSEDHITQQPDRGSSATRQSSTDSKALSNFTNYRPTTISGKERETFTLSNNPESVYVRDNIRETVTPYEKISDGYYFKGDEIPENVFRNSIITTSPSARASTTSRSQSPKIQRIAVPYKEIELEKEEKSRASEIASTEISFLSEDDHTKFNNYIQEQGPSRINIAFFYIRADLEDKLKTVEMKQKYPELENQELRQAVAKEMARKVIKENQQRQSEIRTSMNSQRSSLFGRVSSAFSPQIRKPKKLL